jgi:hypothetical protein
MGIAPLWLSSRTPDGSSLGGEYWTDSDSGQAFRPSTCVAFTFFVRCGSYHISA